METIRLQKFMAEAGAGSRRKCEEWISQGLVQVNGETVRELGSRVDPEKDQVFFRGRRLERSLRKRTVMLNKPEGYITTNHDPFGRPHVTELVKISGERLYPIGRLDYQTSGLLLLTNDGDLAYQLTHPKHHIAKCYRAIVKGRISREELAVLRRGVVLDDGYKTAPAKVRYVADAGENSRIEITIYEGKNHQVRRMARQVGHPVLRLKRISVGGILLGDLKEGEYRELGEDEVRKLRESALS